LCGNVFKTRWIDKVAVGNDRGIQSLKRSETNRESRINPDVASTLMDEMTGKRKRARRALFMR